MFTDLLKRFNFTDKEAKIYLTTLEMGQAPASSIARRAKENRVTTYSCLKALKNRGISYEQMKGNTAYFGVVEPDVLLMKEKEKIDLLEKKLPELMALANLHVHKPKIWFFEGEQWLIDQYDDLLTSKDDEICSFFTCKYFKESINLRLAEDFLPKRIALGIPVRVIMRGDPEDDLYTKKSDDTLLRKLITIPDDCFELWCNIDIYANNKVSLVLWSEEELVGLIIQSEKFYRTMKGLFNLIRRAYSP